MTLRDALSKSQAEIMRSTQSNTQMGMNRTELKKAFKNGMSSKKFIKNNKKAIDKYLSEVMKSEEKMIGYLEFTNNKIIEDKEVEEATKVTTSRIDIESVSKLQLNPNLSSDLLEKKEKAPNAINDAHKVSNKVMESWLN
jgi:hypothetical protein